MIFPFNHIDDNYYTYIIYVAKLIFNRFIRYVAVISKNRNYWRMTSFVYGILYRCA